MSSQSIIRDTRRKAGGQVTDVQFGWAPGSHHKIKPDAAGQIVRDLHARGEMTPEGVVRHAADPASPLHPEINWDDSDAAAKYRLIQGRAILTHLVVRYRQADDTYSEPLRYTVKLTYANDEEKSLHDDPALVPNVYVPLLEAMANPVHRDRVLHRALADFLVLRRKYREYEELARVFDEIDKLREQFDLAQSA